MAICGLVDLLANEYVQSREPTDSLKRADGPQVRTQMPLGGSAGLGNVGIFGLEKLCGEARMHVTGVEGQIICGELAQPALIRDAMHMALVRFLLGTPSGNRARFCCAEAITRACCGPNWIRTSVMCAATIWRVHYAPQNSKIEPLISSAGAVSPKSLTDFLKIIEYPHRPQLRAVLADA
jgi:hypothetical protein